MLVTALISIPAAVLVGVTPVPRPCPPATQPTACPFRFHLRVIPPTTHPFHWEANPPNLMPFAPAPGQIVPGREPVPKDWIRKEFNGEPFYIIPCGG